MKRGDLNCRHVEERSKEPSMQSPIPACLSACASTTWITTYTVCSAMDRGLRVRLKPGETYCWSPPPVPNLLTVDGSARYGNILSRSLSEYQNEAMVIRRPRISCAKHPVKERACWLWHGRSHTISSSFPRTNSPQSSGTWPPGILRVRNWPPCYRPPQKQSVRVGPRLSVFPRLSVIPQGLKQPPNTLSPSRFSALPCNLL